VIGALDGLGRRAWFADAFVLLVCGGIVGAAALLTPGPDVVSLFGVDIPVVCGFRRFTGWPCPGCGLTRSFVYAAHGQLAASFGAHVLGPVCFALVASQVPWRSWRLYTVAARGARSAG
jgi:hypothetical protein